MDAVFSRCGQREIGERGDVVISLAQHGSTLGNCRPLGYIGGHTLVDTERPAPMPTETLQFLLLLGGWVVAFLLGRELQTGFRLWRLRTAEQRRKDR